MQQRFKDCTVPLQVARSARRRPQLQGEATRAATTSTKKAAPIATEQSSAEAKAESKPSNNVASMPATEHVSGLTCTVAKRSSSKSRQAMKRSRPIRPSLTEQLQAIGAQAEAITSSLRQQTSQPARSSNVSLLTLPVQLFEVGKLTCKYPSPVRFFRDRSEFSFFHPFEHAEVQMVMYYRDMESVSLRNSSRRFEFRINHSLVHFSNDYDPTDRRHAVAIVFASSTDTDKFEGEVLPVIRRQTR